MNFRTLKLGQNGQFGPRIFMIAGDLRAAEGRRPQLCQHSGMVTHAWSVFVIDRWDEEVIDEHEGAHVVRTAVSKTFSGDITGTSDGWMTMARAQRGSMAYVGFERITATIDGRTGTFVLQHNAVGNSEGGDATWTVLADSGTGELRGIRGTAQIARDENGTHIFTLNYDL